MRLAPNTKLVLIGDSLTDCGRVRPIGDGLDALGDGLDALGSGYVALVAALLGAAQPDLHPHIVNMGIGGNTVRDLHARWQADVLSLRPDWLSVMIGTNDVWRHFDSPARPELAVPLAEFARTLDQLVSRTLPTLPGGLVLMTPFYIQPDRADPMRAQMDQYGAAVREIAARHGTLFVNTQAAFDAVLAHTAPAALAPDRVHPTLTGHMVLARAFLQALDFMW